MKLQCAYCGAMLDSEKAISDHFFTYHKMRPSENLEVTATDDLIPQVFVKVRDT